MGLSLLSAHCANDTQPETTDAREDAIAGDTLARGGHFEGGFTVKALGEAAGKQQLVPEFAPSQAVMLSDRNADPSLVGPILESGVDAWILSNGGKITDTAYWRKNDRWKQLRIFALDGDAGRWVRDYGPLGTIDTGSKALTLVDLNYGAPNRAVDDGVPFLASGAVNAGYVSLPRYFEGGNLMINKPGGTCVVTTAWRRVNDALSGKNPLDHAMPAQDGFADFSKILGCGRVLEVPPLPEATGHVDISMKFVSEDTVLVHALGPEVLAQIDLTIKRLEAIAKGKQPEPTLRGLPTRLMPQGGKLIVLDEAGFWPPFDPAAYSASRDGAGVESVAFFKRYRAGVEQVAKVLDAQAAALSKDFKVVRVPALMPLLNPASFVLKTGGRLSAQRLPSDSYDEMTFYPQVNSLLAVGDKKRIALLPSFVRDEDAKKDDRRETWDRDCRWSIKEKVTHCSLRPGLVKVGDLFKPLSYAENYLPYLVRSMNDAIATAVEASAAKAHAGQGFEVRFERERSPELIKDQGAVHCVTMQIPKAPLCGGVPEAERPCCLAKVEQQRWKKVAASVFTADKEEIPASLTERIAAADRAALVCTVKATPPPAPLPRASSTPSIEAPLSPAPSTPAPATPAPGQQSDQGGDVLRPATSESVVFWTDWTGVAAPRDVAVVRLPAKEPAAPEPAPSPSSDPDAGAEPAPSADPDAGAEPEVAPLEHASSESSSDAKGLKPE